MKYKVVVGTLWVDGVKCKRGDIIETDEDFGTNVEPYVEVEAPKPKRKRRTKAEIEAAALSEPVIDVPKFGDGDLA